MENQHIYVVRIYSTPTEHIIKVGQSVNFDNRMKTFKTISPELTTVCRGRGIEYEIIKELATTFEKVAPELFKIPISRSEDFIHKLCRLLHLTGNEDVNSFVLTGCHYTHFRTHQNIYNHRNCSNRCKLKIEYDRKQEQHELDTKYTCMLEHHRDGIQCKTNCYPDTIQLSSKESIMRYALNCIETSTIISIYHTKENKKIGYVNYEIKGDKRSGVNLFIDDKQYYMPCNS